MPENQNLYKSLQEVGYVLIFKPVLKSKDGDVKGNVDAELVLQAIVDFNDYNKAIVVTGNGDFYCLVNYLYSKQKLAMVISPNKERCFILLTRAAKEKIIFMNNLRKKLEYKNEKAPL